MENSRAAAAAAYDSKEDRISHLPEPILHHILCFLDQRTAATTSVLSKPWRYLWCTRPQIDFRHEITVVAGRSKESFLSVLDRTLRGYHHRRLHLQELTLHLSSYDPETDPFLRKWIQILVQSMGASKFHLHFLPIDFSSNRRFTLPLPIFIFRSESLQNLSLKSCELISIPAAKSLHLKHLQKLTLNNVFLTEEILYDILSNCRFLEYVSLTRCTGYKRIELKHPPAANLKELCFYDYRGGYNSTTIAMGGVDNIPTLKRIDIRNCLLSLNHNHQFYFSHLTHLRMINVMLSSTDGLFSCNLPCLEELRLCLCSGIKEFNLSSPSMKRLEITNTNCPFKVTVDAPSIVTFRYKGLLPQSISFSAAPTSWKSYIELSLDGSSSCFNELVGLFKALSQSKICMEINERTFRWLLDMKVGVSHADLPIVVDHIIAVDPKGSCSTAYFLTGLFRVIRPRVIYMASITQAFLTETYQVFKRFDSGQRLMKGASVQVFYRNKGKWKSLGSAGIQMFLPVEMREKTS